MRWRSGETTVMGLATGSFLQAPHQPPPPPTSPPSTPPLPAPPSPSRPLWGAADQHLVPSSAVDSHLQLWPLLHRLSVSSIVQLQSSTNIFSPFFLFHQCSCLKEMPRLQNARLHCFQRMARFFNGVKQLTANVDRENTLWLQIQRKCAQTLFSASHNFPSTQMQQKRAARDQIHNNSVSCDRQFLETVQLSIKRNLHNPQSRVRQFYDSARRKTWKKSVPIYSGGSYKAVENS